jgi:hypothetical protein
MLKVGFPPLHEGGAPAYVKKLFATPARSAYRMPMSIPLIDEPLNRLRAFRTGFADDAVVDDVSGLTAADLDMIIHQTAGTANIIPVEEFDTDALKDFAPIPPRSEAN